MTNIYGQCIKIWRLSCLHLSMKMYLLLSKNLCKGKSLEFFLLHYFILNFFSFLKLCFIFMNFFVLWGKGYFGIGCRNYDLKTKTRFSQFLLLRLFNLVLSLNIIMCFCEILVGIIYVLIQKLKISFLAHGVSWMFFRLCNQVDNTSCNQFVRYLSQNTLT
jgi:hypothetical protein